MKDHNAKDFLTLFAILVGMCLMAGLGIYGVILKGKQRVAEIEETNNGVLDPDEWRKYDTETRRTASSSPMMSKIKKAIEAKRRKADYEARFKEEEQFCGKGNTERYGETFRCIDYSLVPDENLK